MRRRARSLQGGTLPEVATLLENIATSPPDRTRALLLASLVSCAVHLGLIGLVSMIPFGRRAAAPPPVVVMLIPAAPLAIGPGAPVAPSLAPPAPATLPRELPASKQRVAKKPSSPRPVARLATPAPVITPDALDRPHAAENAADTTSDSAPGLEEGGSKESGSTSGVGASGSAVPGGAGGNGFASATVGANPKPPYPALARRMHVEGVVLLRVHVRSDGGVASVEIANSSGSSLLDDSALRTVRDRWRFEPARRGDESVQSWLQIPMRFQLE